MRLRAYLGSKMVCLHLFHCRCTEVTEPAQHEFIQLHSAMLDEFILVNSCGYAEEKAK